MKKLHLIWAVLLCGCLIMSSCNTVSTNNDLGTTNDSVGCEKVDETIDYDMLNNDLETTNVSSGHYGIEETEDHETDLDSVDVDYPSMWSYSDYQEFINSTKLPDDFVYYDDIREIGAFYSLVYQYENGYAYEVLDATGDRLVFSMVPVKVEEQLSTIRILTSADINPADMRKTSHTDTSCVYTHEGIRYVYVEGKLLYVSWENKGWECRISKSTDPKNGFSKYDATMAHTTVGKLLNLSSAAETMAAISAPSVSKK